LRTPRPGQPGKYRDNEINARHELAAERGGRPDRPSRPGRTERPVRPERRPGGPNGPSGPPNRPGPRRTGTGPGSGGSGTRPGGPGARSGGGRPSGNRPGGRPRDTKPAVQVRGDPLFGRNAVLETLRAESRAMSHLWIADGLKPDERLDEITELAEAAGILVEVVPRALLDDITEGVNHQGVLLEVGDYRYADLQDVIERRGTILVLDHVQDPQNFGTLLRTADAAGIAGVVIPSDRSVSVSPAVVNASAGAVEHLKIAQVANIARALEKIEASGRWIVGLDSGEGSKNILETDVPTPVALVVGSEGTGISQGVLKRCQLVLSIPMLGKIESLNAATAGSIVIYDILRREQEELGGALEVDDFEGDGFDHPSSESFSDLQDEGPTR
jgi:23S rRNA (guanosine2251-2'-O)-methyltransferase